MNHFGRRSLLKALGSSALALPILEAFEGHGPSGDARPSVSSFGFQTCGTIESEYRPKGSERPIFSFGRILAPLEAYKKRMFAPRARYRRSTPGRREGALGV